MTIQRFPAETDDRRTAGQRALAAITAVRSWASTEFGGWIIVGVLALLAIVVAGAAVMLPRMNAVSTSTPISASASPVGNTGQIDTALEFTLAPEALQDLDQAAARLWNATLPFSADPIRPAKALIAPTDDLEAYTRALDCLTTAVYYEAASETAQGQAAVAQVILNRARHPAYPRSICGVVFQGSERTTGCQFSFTCDGAMARVPSAAGWARARSVASAALNGTVVAAVGTATHYHTDWVAPYWAPRLSKIVQIGTHIFYRWHGAWGLPSAFTGVYAGTEPAIPKMAGLSTLAAETPVEILATVDLRPDGLDALPVSRLSSAVGAPLVVPAATTDQIETAEVAPVEQEPVRPTTVLQRDVPIMADPLANAGAPPTRQRQRIAAPSGW